jgi:hypothetical protein
MDPTTEKIVTKDAQGNTIYLDEDPIRVPGANFVLLSFVSPNSTQKSEKCGLKVRGVFETREQAEAHVKRLMTVDPDFDVFVADLYRWLLVPPNASEVQEEEYTNAYLNGLIKTHKTEQDKAKQAFEEYKRDLMENPRPLLPLLEGEDEPLGEILTA